MPAGSVLIFKDSEPRNDGAKGKKGKTGVSVLDDGRLAVARHAR